MRPTPTRRLALSLLALLAVPSVSMAAHLPVSGGPKEILIAYRAQPADRPAFRAYLAAHIARSPAIPPTKLPEVQA